MVMEKVYEKTTIVNTGFKKGKETSEGLLLKLLEMPVSHRFVSSYRGIFSDSEALNNDSAPSVKQGFGYAMTSIQDLVYSLCSYNTETGTSKILVEFTKADSTKIWAQHLEKTAYLRDNEQPIPDPIGPGKLINRIRKILRNLVLHTRWALLPINKSENWVPFCTEHWYTWSFDETKLWKVSSHQPKTQGKYRWWSVYSFSGQHSAAPLPENYYGLLQLPYTLLDSVEGVAQLQEELCRYLSSSNEIWLDQSLSVKPFEEVEVHDVRPAWHTTKLTQYSLDTFSADLAVHFEFPEQNIGLQRGRYRVLEKQELEETRLFTVSTMLSEKSINEFFEQERVTSLQEKLIKSFFQEQETPVRVTFTQNMYQRDIFGDQNSCMFSDRHGWHQAMALLANNGGGRVEIHSMDNKPLARFLFGLGDAHVRNEVPTRDETAVVIFNCYIEQDNFSKLFRSTNDDRPIFAEVVRKALEVLTGVPYFSMHTNQLHSFSKYVPKSYGIKINKDIATKLRVSSPSSIKSLFELEDTLYVNGSADGAIFVQADSPTIGSYQVSLKELPIYAPKGTLLALQAWREAPNMTVPALLLNFIPYYGSEQYQVFRSFVREQLTDPYTSLSFIQTKENWHDLMRVHSSNLNNNRYELNTETVLKETRLRHSIYSPHAGVSIKTKIRVLNGLRSAVYHLVKNSPTFKDYLKNSVNNSDVIKAVTAYNRMLLAIETNMFLKEKCFYLGDTCDPVGAAKIASKDQKLKFTPRSAMLLDPANPARFYDIEDIWDREFLNCIGAKAVIKNDKPVLDLRKVDFTSLKSTLTPVATHFSSPQEIAYEYPVRPSKIFRSKVWR